uniref:Uncharacterized protein n=1 Tax=Anopheles maculatus TaxID=74869 RepID=A0A182SJ73_9DIPT
MVGALSTNFFACTRFMPSSRFFTSLISATFCFSSNLTSFTLNVVLTTFGAASSSSAAAGAAPPAPAANAPNPAGIMAVSGRLSFRFSNVLSSDTSSRFSWAILSTMDTSFGSAGFSVPSGTGIVSFGELAEATAASACRTAFVVIWRILKKQQALPSTNGRASPVASLSSAFKSSRKIEFNRKKSVKEFLVGEDVDTIWGNSYEVSTDGTPSSGLDDATLANSTSPSITVDEQDKENRSLNQPAPVGDDSLRRSSINGTNTSWDLSITIADDERRRIRNETSAVFSQSLNTTERLLVEPVAVTRAPANVRIKLNGLQVSDDTEVQAMDISPLKPNVQPSPSKSPRKMIYTFPKQAMFVEINDVPGMSVDGAQSAHQQRDEQKTPSIRPSWRTTTSGTGSQMHRSSYSDVSETWNSHPHAVFHQRMLAQTRDGGDMANVSSDVDTTIALTNAMTKVLQSCTNESIQQAANMELDESTTTTIPTNALARARPSFLPSNQRPSVDESQCLDVGADRTPISIRQPEKETLPADISSPLEGHTQRNSLSFDNLSLLNDMKLKEADTHKRDTLEQQEQIEVEKCSVEEGKREVFKIDFGLSSLSMNGRPSSPEMPVVVKPRILRPTLPPGMLLEIAKSEMKQTDSKDESDRTRMTFSRQQAIECSEDPDRAEDGGKKSLVPMDISTSGEHHTIGKPSIASIHSRLTVDMVESPKQPRQTGRSTVFTSHDIELEDRVELPGKHRGTVLSDEKMELTAHVAATTPRPADSGQQELILDETTGRLIKRATVLGTVPIDESFTDCFSPHSPQTALNNYRKTVYPLERMKEDVRKVPDRQTIVCNDSMALDVCATPTQAKTGAGSSSISCVVYGRNVDELSIHATRGNNAMDVTFARPAAVPSDCRQTLLQQENMTITEATVSNRTLVTRSERLTTHAVRAMEEDESAVDSCAKQGSNTTTRKSNFNPEAMELTTVEKATEIILERSGEVRHTMHATEVMDESRVEPALCVRMDTIGHAELQACVDLHQTHQIEEMMAP